MSMTNEVGLRFKINADSKQAVDELRSFGKSVDTELKSIKGSFKETGLGVANSLGISTKDLASYAAGWKLAGGVILGAGAIAGMVGGTLFAMAQKAAAAGSAYNDLSIKTGLSVETLSGLDLQLKQSGTSLETFSNAVFIMQKNLEGAATGGKEMRAAFANLGVRDANGALADTEGTIRTLLTSLAKIPDEARRNAEGARIFGKAYKDLAVFVADTNGNIDDAIAKAKELGTLMSTESARAADEFGDAMDTVNTQLQAASSTMALQFLPVMTDGLNDLSTYLADNQESWKSWGDSVASHMETVMTIMRAMNEADHKMGNDPLWAFKYGDAFLESFDRITDERAKKASYDKDHPWTNITKPREGGGTRSRDGGGGGGSKERGAMLQEETQGLEREYRAQTEIIRREQDLQLTSLREATLRTIQAEKDRYDALLEGFNKESALAQKQSDKTKIEGNIRAAQLERDQNIQKAKDTQYSRERAALEAHADALLKLGETRDAQRIASIQAQADLRKITYERAEEKIGQIETNSFKRRLSVNLTQQKALQTLAGYSFDEFGQVIENEAARARLNVEAFDKLTDEAIQLVQEWDGQNIEAERRRVEARKKDLQNTREWAREMRELELSVFRAALDVGQMDINRMRRRNQDKRDVAKAQADLDREAEGMEHDAAMQKIADDQAVFNGEVHTFEERFAALKVFNELRELEELRHRRRLKEIRDGEKEESGEGGDLLDPLRAVLNERISLHEFAAQAIAGTFRTITDAVGDTVKSYVLYEELTGKLVRKAVAEQIASLASLAFKQGLYWTAQGIADLFWNPPRAAADFAAAAGFFAVGGGLAFVGRKVAGNAFKDQASGGSLGTGGGEDGNGVRYRDFNYNSGAQPSSAIAGDGSRGFAYKIIK